MMKIIKIVLALMILNDFLLHMAGLFKWFSRYLLWQFFPVQGTVAHQIFWTVYWGIGLILAVTLFFEKRR